MKKIIYLVVFILSNFPLFAHAKTETADIENAVVKIHVTIANPDYVAPWRLGNPVQGSGSGVIISEQRILTNAHVVANAKYIQVQKNKDPNKYIAEVSFVSHEADLALLKVKDKSFFAQTKPLLLGSLPKPYEEVAVFGYPMGGETLSITKGILSRVEHQIYTHAESYLLAGQLDAAVNYGNSGGPVIAHQKIVGIVMQGMDREQADSIGYFIPPSVIAHVLKDSEDGKDDGFPTLGFTTQALENPAAKAYFGLKPNQNGVLVTRVFADSDASKILKKNDVILKFDKFQITSDGSIDYTPTLHTDAKYAIDLHHVGDKIQITYARAGKINTAYLIAQRHPKRHEMIIPPEFDTIPRYYIYGGIIFVPLTANLNNLLESAPSSNEIYETSTKREVVLALRVLPADINFGYNNAQQWAVDFVNGVPIYDFVQFVKIVEQNKAKYMVFEDKNGLKMVINHALALKTEAEIFKNYGIPARYSKNLFK